MRRSGCKLLPDGWSPNPYGLTGPGQRFAFESKRARGYRVQSEIIHQIVHKIVHKNSKSMRSVDMTRAYYKIFGDQRVPLKLAGKKHGRTYT